MGLASRSRRTGSLSTTNCHLETALIRRQPEAQSGLYICAELRSAPFPPITFVNGMTRLNFDVDEATLLKAYKIGTLTPTYV